MTRTILSITTVLAAAALTACDGDSQKAAKPAPSKPSEAAKAPAKPKIEAARLPGAPVSGDGTELGKNVLFWTIAEGTGEMLPIEPTMATMKVSGWSMNGSQFFGDAEGGDELILPTGDGAAFSGWAAAIGNMKVGETRKVWIGSKGRERWPLGGDSPQDVVWILNSSRSAMSPCFQIRCPVRPSPTRRGMDRHPAFAGTTFPQEPALHWHRATPPPFAVLDGSKMAHPGMPQEDYPFGIRSMPQCGPRSPKDSSE